MAYISQRGEYGRAEIRRSRYKPVYRSFDTKQQAQKWARRVEGKWTPAHSSTDPRPSALA